MWKNFLTTNWVGLMRACVRAWVGWPKYVLDILNINKG